MSRFQQLPFDIGVESSSDGTVNENQAFKRFLSESSKGATAIVNEAYLEYTDDFGARSDSTSTSAAIESSLNGLSGCQDSLLKSKHFEGCLLWILQGMTGQYLVVPGIGFQLALVIAGALAEDFRAHHWNAEDRSNEMNHLFGPGQPTEAAVDDNAVKAVIYNNELTAKQLGERLPSVILLCSRLDNKIIGQTTGGVRISNIFCWN